MDIQVLQILTQIGWAGVAGLFVYYVLKPIFERIFNGGLYKRLNNIENNHLTEITKRIEKLEERVDDIDRRLSRIEGRLNNLSHKLND